MVALVKACDAGVFYLWETEVALAAMPNKLFDYLAGGLPVVVNAKGELARHLVDEDAGCVVPSDSPDGFAAALVQLADDPERRRAQGRNAARLAAEQFDRARLVDELERVLTDVAR
jgi:colanic acid biosynthesis glycosyl transferase WcaI